MKKQQSGFTLIELMIVVAIIGILAAIAIPSYMDYQKKAKVSEAPLALSPAKAAISEYYLMNEGWPATSTAGGFSLGTASENFGTITYVAASGKLELPSLSNVLGASLTIVLLPDTSSEDGVIWECKSEGKDLRLAPASCR
jgi:type IV pilus assembly protein PilA